MTNKFDLFQLDSSLLRAATGGSSKNTTSRSWRSREAQGGTEAKTRSIVEPPDAGRQCPQDLGVAYVGIQIR